MISGLIGLLVGLLVGLAAGWLLRPLLEARAIDALPMLKSFDAVVSGESALTARLDAEIAEIELQIRQGHDVDRNGTRLQILRDVKGGQ